MCACFFYEGFRLSSRNESTENRGPPFLLVVTWRVVFMGQRNNVGKTVEVISVSPRLLGVRFKTDLNKRVSRSTSLSLSN